MIKLQAKRFELNFLLKFSDLKSNFTLTLGYLNPNLNNQGLHIRERPKDVDLWRQKASKTKLYTIKEHGRNLEKHPEQTKTNRQGAIYRNALFTDRLQTELNAILSFYHY